MALKVRYSLRARQEEIELLDYIVRKFGTEKANQIYQRIEKVLEAISKMPDMYKASEKQTGLRECILSKQTSIYYRVQEDHIEVVSFRPNRKDPDQF